MSEQADQDRNLAASPYKLEQARKRGNVARSPEVAGALVFTIAVVALHWRGWDGVQGLARLARSALSAATQISVDGAALWPLCAALVAQAGALLGPLLAAVVLAAAVAGLVQIGPLLSFEPIKPDWNRLDPVAGLKRIFSVRVLFDAFKALVKVGILTAVAWSTWIEAAPRFARLGSLGVAGFGHEVISVAASAGLKLALAIGLIALLDFGFNRHQFAKQMRMSHREVREEIRHREGDPRIRARLRALRKEMLARANALSRTKSADVVVVNPTHFAVALRYDEATMIAPTVVSKGAGAMALAMRRVAGAHGVPIVSNAPLARALYREVRLDDTVPGNHYAEVARLMVWVLTMRRGANRRSGAAA